MFEPSSFFLRSSAEVHAVIGASIQLATDGSKIPLDPDNSSLLEVLEVSCMLIASPQCLQILYNNLEIMYFFLFLL